MQSKPHAAVLGLILVFASSACSQQQPQSAEAPMAQDATVSAESAAGGAPAPASALDAKVDTVNGDAQLDSSAATYTDAERKFIRTAKAEFGVRDVYRSALAIEDMVAAHGGFVVRNEISSQVDRVESRPRGDGKLIELATYTTRATLQVRVPSEKTQTFLRALAGQIEFLDRRTFEAVDAQFELLRQQLVQQRNQEAQQALGEATAEGGKLARKAEAIAGRNEAKAARDEALIAQKTFEDQIAFSTIDLSLYQQPQIRRTERVDVDAAILREGPGFVARARDALSTGWYGLLTALVVMLHLWPLWLVLLSAVLVVRWRRKQR